MSDLEEVTMSLTVSRRTASLLLTALSVAVPTAAPVEAQTAASSPASPQRNPGTPASRRLRDATNAVVTNQTKLPYEAGRQALDKTAAELKALREKLLQQEIAYIESLQAAGRRTLAQEEFLRALTAGGTAFDVSMINSRLKKAFPDFHFIGTADVGAPDRSAFASDVIQRFHNNNRFRHGYDVDFDASELENVLKDSVRQCEKLNGVNSPQAVQSQMDLCILYTGQFRRAESRAQIAKIAALYPKLTSEQQHFFALPLIDLAYNINSSKLSGESSLLAKPVLTAMNTNSWPFDGELHQKLTAYASKLEGHQRYVDAEDVYKAALRMCERSPERDELALAKQQKHLAGLLVRLKKFSTAEELYLMALEIEEKKLGADNVVTTESRLNLAKLFLESGKRTEAKNMLQPIFRAVDSVDDAHARELQRKLVDAATTFTAQDDLESAKDLLTKALSLGTRTNTLTINDYTYHLEPLARALNARGQTDQAVKLYEAFTKSFEDAGKGDSRDYVQLLQQAVRFYLEHDMFDRAMPLLRQRLALSKSVDPGDYKYRLREFAETLHRKERHADAQLLYEELTAGDAPKNRDQLPQYLHDNLTLMLTYSHQKKYADAERVCLKSVETLSPFMGKVSPALNQEVSRLVKDDIANHDYASAQNTIQSLLYTDFVRGSGTDAVNALMQIAWRYNSKDSERATSLMRQSADLAKRNYGEGDARTAQILTRLADQLRRNGNQDEADSITKQADAIRTKLLNKQP